MVAIAATGQVDPAEQVGTALAAAVLAAGLATLDLRGAVAWPRFMVTSGEGAYSLYLVHTPAIAAAGATLMWLKAPLTVCVVVLTAVGTGAGFGFFRWVERPLNRTIRQLQNRWHGATPPSAVEIGASPPRLIADTPRLGI